MDGVASLQLTNVSRVDSGEYTCSAANRHGRVSTTCDVRVKADDDVKPSAPTFTTSLRGTSYIYHRIVKIFTLISLFH